ncbi:putative pleiotropic drug resistance protein PDR/CDR [Plasmopara halstedii]
MTSFQPNEQMNKRKSSNSFKAKPLSTADFSSSISSRSSEPMPILESFFIDTNPKHYLRHQRHTCGSRNRRTTTRNGVQDSPFKPHRPVGAVPKIHVSFRHLSLAVDGFVSPVAADQAALGQTGRETLAAKQLPTITNHVRGVFAGLTARKSIIRRQILKNVTGAFTPGSMTLILGRSGSGKSVLLKLLSGRLAVSNKTMTLHGEIAYSGLSYHDLRAQLARCIAYVPQQDSHLPMMTVKETLDFAFECCAVRVDAKPVGAVYKSSALEFPFALPMTYLCEERDPISVTRELGLTRCQDTIMGDERVRGVSGGEKKRVTTGEMTFGPHAVAMMDDITMGLDSSAAYDVVNAQRRMAKKQLQTVVIALQQPAPEILALFDNVLLLADGEVLYHGPRCHVQAYFEALGFVCPPERDLTEFLCDLASPQQIQYEHSRAPMPGRRRHPRQANEFADLWIMSPMYEAMIEELDKAEFGTEVYSLPDHQDGDRELVLDQKALLQLPAFRHSFVRSTWTVVKRQLRLFVRNQVFLVGRLLLDLLVGLMVGSVHYSMDLADVHLTLGVTFSCALFLGLGQSAILSPLFDARKVFYKHRSANFYRTSSYVLASSLSQFPLAVTEAIIFSSLVYWMGGLVATWENFLVFLVYMLLTVLVFVGEYFFLSAACSSLLVAQPASTLVLLIWVLSAGFAVSREQLPWAMRWIYWSNPLAWTTRGILVSQYRSSQLDVCVYGGIDYCKKFENQTFGTYSLGLYEVPDDPKWVMLGIVFLGMVYIVSMWSSYIMLEYYSHESSLALPPELPGSLTNPKITRQQKDSYAILSTPQRDEFYDVAGFPDRNEIVVVEEDGGLNNSFYLSQGVPTMIDDVEVCLTPRWNVPPVTIAFQDLRYKITVPATEAEELAGQRCVGGAQDHHHAGKSTENKTRELLKGVTAYALPGTMTALMGSSGAGKTTLLDVLAGRKRGKIGSKQKKGVPSFQGRVLLNGVDATEVAVRRCTGYCEQIDVHSDGSTFREALQFSAYLRQSDKVAPGRIEEIVTECLELLGLSNVADQLIRGSTCEQLKRLTLGVELVAQSSVLFLDEPTSGLDASAAKSLMDGVRRVADSGRTVICTIHQPSTEVFLLFDRLLLLQRGGETVYFGELGHKGETVVNYFQQLSLPHSLPTFKCGDNPATWVLDAIGAGFEKAKHFSTIPTTVTQSSHTATKNSRIDASLNSSMNSECSHQHQDVMFDFAAAYRSSRLKQLLDAKQAIPGVFMPSDRLAPVTFAQRRAASNTLQFIMLMRRFLRLYWRTPLYSLTRMVTALVLGFMFGIVYSGNIDFSTYQGANGAVGLIFFSTCFLGVSSYVQILPLAYNERGPFYRERDSETYSAFWYFVASSLVEIPYAAVSSTIFVSVFYPMTGFSEHGDVTVAVIYWMVLTIHILFQTYFGQFFTFAMPTVELAAVWGALFDSIFLMFMGYNPPASSIPNEYKWLSQLVPHRYTFEMLTALVLGDCSDNQLQQIAEAATMNATIDVSSYPLGCQLLRDAPPAVANIPLSLYIDEVFNARRLDMNFSLAVVMGLLLFMRLVTLVVMRIIDFKRR